MHLRTLLNQNELLLSEASAAIGISATGFQALVHALPDFEFYLPEKPHRLTWRPGQPYWVMAVAEPRDFEDPVVTIFDGAGTPFVVNVLENMPAEALFAIVPVEADFSRPDVPRRDFRGDAVQSPDECHPLAKGCTVEGVSFTLRTNSLSGLADGRLRYFKLLRDRDGIGSNEIEFWYYMEGSSEDPGTSFAAFNSPTPPCQRFTGIDANVTYQLDRDLGNYYPLPSFELGSEFWEDDHNGCELSSTTDDLVGRPNNFFQPAGGTSKAEAYPHASLNFRQPVQWEDNIGGSGTITDAEVLFEINYYLHASMSGPSNMDPFENGQWTVSVFQGTGSYSYYWTQDGVPVGTDSPSYSTSAGISDFSVHVVITDLGTGAKTVQQQSVVVCSDDPGGCPQ